MRILNLFLILTLSLLLQKTSFGSINSSKVIDTIPAQFDSTTGFIPIHPLVLHQLRDTLTRQKLEIKEHQFIKAISDSLNKENKIKIDVLRSQKQSFQNVVDEFKHKEQVYTKVYHQYREDRDKRLALWKSTEQEYINEIEQLERKSWWANALAIIATIGGAVMAIAL